MTGLALPDHPHVPDEIAIRKIRRADQQIGHELVENALDELKVGAQAEFAKAMIVKDILDALARVQIVIRKQDICITEIAHTHNSYPLASTT